MGLMLLLLFFFMDNQSPNSGPRVLFEGIRRQTKDKGSVVARFLSFAANKAVDQNPIWERLLSALICPSPVEDSGVTWD